MTTTRRPEPLKIPFFAAALTMAVTATVSFAQNAGPQEGGVRIYEEELRAKLDQQSPQARELGFDAGGWFNFALFNYQDQNNQQRNLRQYEVRPWASFNDQGVNKFYVRGLVGYDDWNTGENPNGKDNEWEEPSLERAWYQFDLGQLLYNETGKTPPVAFRFKVGREFMTIGTSFVLAQTLDMVQWEVAAGDWQLMFLLGKTVTHTPNLVDQSPAVEDHQDRCLFGTQLTYKGFDHHQPFIYFLDNSDHTQPWPYDSKQSYDYSSRYLGAGSTGTILLPDLRYQTELVGEWGRTYGNGAKYGEDDICAVAYDALLEYVFQMPKHPTVGAEYIFASGDHDRELSSSATVGGNKPGTTDTAFNAFGFRDTGISFAPQISSINIYDFGGGFFPLEEHKLFEKLEIGTKVFFYQKSSSGPISDTTASESSRWLGWEWDVYANWRITSDLTWTVRYGVFMPGDAFASDECRNFLYTGVTFSF
jgi:hypothetical protein